MIVMSSDGNRIISSRAEYSTGEFPSIPDT
jgi:hypothetical protein